jgi:hypothetical protein
MATYKKEALSAAPTGVAIPVTAVALTSAAITNVIASGGTITYTATHAFTAGELVTITGVISSTNTTGAPNFGYNLSNVPIASVTGTTSFAVSNAATGTWTSGGIAVANPATLTPIHTTQADATKIDEIWLYATNTATTAVQLTIFYGGTATGSSQLAPIIQTIPAQSGLTLVVPGLILTSASAITVAAFATALSTTSNAASVINISGYVNRIA